MSPKTNTTEDSKNPSELRQDIITGDWVVIATGRAKRPDEFVAPRAGKTSHKDPFENPKVSKQKADILIYRQNNGN